VIKTNRLATALRQLFLQQVDILPLVVFRIAFGLLMCISQIRFVAKGWVEELYLAPTYHFTYTGFSWVKPLPEAFMYWLVYLSIVLAFFIAIGLFYRIAILLFFLAFTYLELIDKALYLNHYYFISLVAFLLIFLPAHKAFSVDSLRYKWPIQKIAQWPISVLRLQLGIVYFFAGVAKIKYDWLVLGQPLKIWLTARADMPYIGHLFTYDFVPYLFSWGGMLYDLSIPFLLFYRKTRKPAYLLVIFFHVLTFAMFYIGMFPWIMIACTLIFFEGDEWRRLFPGIPKASPTFSRQNKSLNIRWLLIPYFALQFFLPLRHHIYEGNVLENEKGLRFAWHVMVMEKNGHVEYQLEDVTTGNKWKVAPSSYLTLAQEKQMSFQPDMIVQFGIYLKDNYRAETGKECRVTAKNWTSLNGRPSVLTLFSADQF